ncbi:hypothetical protein C7E25_22070, partial [Stenotrophomonas maltophilia]
RQGLVGQDDNDDAVFGMVLMRKGEEPSDVLDALHARIAEIEANQLPAGVEHSSRFVRPLVAGHATLRRSSATCWKRQGLVGQDDNDDAVFGMVLMRKGEEPSDVLDAL